MFTDRMISMYEDLYKTKPSHETLIKLERLAKVGNLHEHDTIWLIILFLEFYSQSYEEIPEKISDILKNQTVEVLVKTIEDKKIELENLFNRILDLLNDKLKAVNDSVPLAINDSQVAIENHYLMLIDAFSEISSEFASTNKLISDDLKFTVNSLLISLQETVKDDILDAVSNSIKNVIEYHDKFLNSMKEINEDIKSDMNKLLANFANDRGKFSQLFEESQEKIPKRVDTFYKDHLQQIKDYLEDYPQILSTRMDELRFSKPLSSWSVISMALGGITALAGLAFSLGYIMAFNELPFWIKTETSYLETLANAFLKAPAGIFFLLSWLPFVIYFFMRPVFISIVNTNNKHPCFDQNIPLKKRFILLILYAGGVFFVFLTFLLIYSMVFR